MFMNEHLKLFTLVKPVVPTWARKAEMNRKQTSILHKTYLNTLGKQIIIPIEMGDTLGTDNGFSE
jgi:hypothetical protein